MIRRLKDTFRASYRVISIAKPSWPMVGIAMFFSACASVFQLVGLGLIVPVLNGLVDDSHYIALLRGSTLGRIISSLPFEQTNESIFIFLISFILISVYLENICVYLGQFFYSKIVTNINNSLRQKIFSRYLSFSKAFYDKEKMGELNVILTTLVTNVGQHYNNISQMLTVSAFSVAFLVMMLIISWKLTLLSLLVLPIINLIAKGLMKRIRKSASEEVNHLMGLSEHSLNAMSNMSLVQISNCEGLELKKSNYYSENVREHGFKMRARRYLVPRVVDLVNSTGIVVLGCAAVFFFITEGGSSIGRLSVFFISLRRLASHVEQLTSMWAYLIGEIPALEKVAWVFDDNDKSFIKNGDIEFQGLKDKIEFKNVNFSYEKGREAIKDFSFNINSGETVAVVGTTGSGKSTLINLLARFYDVSSGEIRIDGENISNFTQSSYRRKLALVSQGAMIINGTIQENITYGLDRSEFEIEELHDAARKAEVHDFIESLADGYKTMIGSSGVELSGGEKQRISIARAILKNPDILILDEPTSALDAETESEVQKAIEVLAKDRTVFVVAHRLSTIQNADKIIVLEKGEIVETGKAEQLLASKGKFYNYCEMQRIN